MWRSVLILLILHVLVMHDGTAAAATDESEGCHEEEGISSTVAIAKLQLEEIRTPMIISAFILIVILVKIGWHHPMMHYLSSKIPESLVLITIGTFIGGFLVSAFLLEKCNEDEVFPVRFTPHLFFLYLLPPIVFASGYFMNLKAFFENFPTIVVFALIGTVWNAFASGFSLYGLSAANLMSSNLDIPSALLFGTISAAVDPVAVLAVFDEIHVNQLLHILVFGESLLNDAVTIVLFQVLSAFANIPFDNETEHNTTVDIIVGVFQFFVVVIASIIIGLISGFVGVLMTRVSHHVHVLEPVMLYTVGFVSYLAADLFAFSGIVSLITCAIIMKHYVAANIAWKSNITFKYTLKMLNIISEMVIFLFLGISLFDNKVHKWDTGLVLWTLFFSSLFRPIGVVVLSLFMNLFRLHKITMKQMFIMSYSGLRGAVAFSLALTRVFEPGFDSLPQEEQDLRKSMLTATTVLVLFTVFVQGSTIKPLVQRIGVKLDSKTNTLNEVIHQTTIDHINTGLEDIAGHFGFNILKEFFQFLDVKYFRKIFERHVEAVDEEILRKFQTLQLKETSSQIFDKHTVCPDEDHEHEETKQLFNEHIQNSEDDKFVPTVQEVLQMSFPHPHDHHFPHVLSKDEHEIQDHRLQRIKAHHIVRKRTNKKKHRLDRRQTTLGVGYTRRKEEVDFEDMGTGGHNEEGVVTFTVNEPQTEIISEV